MAEAERKGEDVDPESDLFWAWFAGFVDGEGTITVNATGSRWISYVPMFVVVNTNRAIIDEIATAIGCGGLGHVERDGPNRDMHKIVLYSANAIEVVRRLRPYLRLKTAQADLLLSFPLSERPGARRTPELSEAQAQICAALRELNKRGSAARNAALA